MASATSDPHSVTAIRSRLPSGISDLHRRALICAVRNPDASVEDIAAKCGVAYRNVRHALDSLLAGVIGEGTTTGEWVERREGVREAETFEELTDKQQAVIEFLARHPSFGWRENTGPELTAAISNTVEDAPDMHPTYPKRVAEQYEDLVEFRMAQLLEQGEDIEVGNDDALDLDAWLAEYRLGSFDSVREVLDHAGLDPAPENLDDLDEADPGAFLTPDERLDLAYENGERREGRTRQVVRSAGPGVDDATLGPLSCPECGHESNGMLACPNCGAAKVHDVPVENHLDEDRDEFTEADVQAGVLYRGVVNGMEPYGWFVTIGGWTNDADDVSGLLPDRLLPASVRGEFSKGAEVHVAVDHFEDEGRKFVLGWPTEDLLAPFVSKAESGHESGTGDETDEDTGDGEAGQDGDESAPTTDESGEGERETFKPWAHNPERERLDEHDERFDAVEAMLDGLEERHESHVTGTGGALSELREAVDDLAARVPEPGRAEQYADDLEHVLDRLRAVEDRLDSVESAFENSIKREVVDMVEAHDERLSALEDALGGEGGELGRALRLAEELGGEISLEIQVKA